METDWPAWCVFTQSERGTRLAGLVCFHPECTWNQIGRLGVFSPRVNVEPDWPAWCVFTQSARGTRLAGLVCFLPE